MPILLTTPFNPGDNDPNVTYPRAKILDINISLLGRKIDLLVAYGNETLGVWTTGGGAGIKRIEITDSPGQEYFTELATTEVIAEETVYDAIKRASYIFLTTHYPAFAGVIE